MRSHGSLPAGLPAIAVGLLVGVLGSFSDNLLGDGLTVAVLQLGLWAISAAIVLPTAVGMVTGHTQRQVERERRRQRRAERRRAGRGQVVAH
ncbi:hypothetical protein [Conexibacter sp. SYSU D00693]|uniref:hypothetical protein n=1 Tax=Conexibacter sp. SYSU D00693 TaxID=2812560 RepID=UPI00196AEC11|nr:hypothetical protein [Conexibacter sp. SYSU D00693]